MSLLKTLHTLSAIAVAATFSSCSHIDQLDDVREVIIDYDPSQELPQFDDLVKKKVVRIEAEMSIFDGWTADDPALKKRIRTSLQREGKFHDTSVVAPNFLYRVNSLKEAEGLFQKIFEDQSDFQSKPLKSLAEKASGISVAFVEPDSVLFLFFDQKDHLMAYHYD